MSLLIARAFFRMSEISSAMSSFYDAATSRDALIPGCVGPAMPAP